MRTLAILSTLVLAIAAACDENPARTNAHKAIERATGHKAQSCINFTPENSRSVISFCADGRTLVICDEDNCITVNMTLVEAP